jgi:DNA-binding NtrC family response regulator
MAWSVLVVSPSGDPQEELVRLFSTHGYRATAATSSESISELIREGLRPTVIVIAAAGEHGELPVFPARVNRFFDQVPIVIITGESAPPNPGGAVAAVVRRPYSTGHLLEVVSGICASSPRAAR